MIENRIPGYRTHEEMATTITNLYAIGEKSVGHKKPHQTNHVVKGQESNPSYQHPPLCPDDEQMNEHGILRTKAVSWTGFFVWFLNVLVNN